MVPGPLADPAVLTGLAATHPFLGLWARALQTRLSPAGSAETDSKWLLFLAGLWHPSVDFTYPVTPVERMSDPPTAAERRWAAAAVARVVAFREAPLGITTMLSSSTGDH